MSKSRRVLIIDPDHEWSRGICERSNARFKGITIQSTASARTAVRRLAQDTVDLAIISKRMVSSPNAMTLRLGLEQPVGSRIVWLTDEQDQIHEFQDSRESIAKATFELDLPYLLAEIFPQEPEPLDPPARSEAPGIKIALVGDANVGKTAMMFRMRTNRFHDLRAMTIGIDFHTFDLELNPRHYRLVVWDMGGQPRFAQIRRSFYRGSKAIGLVFDVNNTSSFYNLAGWWQEVREELGDVPIALVGNKADLPHLVTTSEAEALAQAWGVPYFETSSKSGENIHQLLIELAKYAVARQTPEPMPNPNINGSDATSIRENAEMSDKGDNGSQTKMENT